MTGVIHKVRTLRFRNFRRLFSLYVHIHLKPTPLSPPRTSVGISFFIRDMIGIYFVSYYQSKDQKQCYNLTSKHQDEPWDQGFAF